MCERNYAKELIRTWSQVKVKENEEIKEEFKILILKELQHHFQKKKMAFRYKLVGLTLNTQVLIRVNHLDETVH